MNPNFVNSFFFIEINEKSKKKKNTNLYKPTK